MDNVLRIINVNELSNYSFFVPAYQRGYAVYLYAINNKETFNKELFLDWIRVVRNIVSRGDVDQNGKRPDIVRSPETFIGVIRLIQELSNGCSNIYEYLKCNNIKSTFARAQIQEEKIKSEIINKYPQHKNLIFKIEDNELLRGQISFILKTSGFDGKNIDTIDYELLDKLSSVLSVYFASENDLNDNLRRAMLTIEVNGKYEFYKYWWSYWVVGNATKRKLFIQFREIEYFMNCEMNEYFSNLLLKLTKNNLIEIINNFIPPKNMENWQIRLIKEPDLLEKHCKSKYIAIPDDNSFCYLLKSQRPRDLEKPLFAVLNLFDNNKSRRRHFPRFDNLLMYTKQERFSSSLFCIVPPSGNTSCRTI